MITCTYFLLLGTYFLHKNVEKYSVSQYFGAKTQQVGGYPPYTANDHPIQQVFGPFPLSKKGTVVVFAHFCVPYPVFLETVRFRVYQTQKNQKIGTTKQKLGAKNGIPCAGGRKNHFLLGTPVRHQDLLFLAKTDKKEVPRSKK